MSNHPNWLELLEHATNYSELQSAFSRMAAESTSTNDSQALATSIDEAIRRIEVERGRDQIELDKFSSEYDSFKQQQAGVVGWFKRKMPFTETRKKELGHRDAVHDQQAEILADNFVIARAQMLKERLLEAPQRRMGIRPHDLRDRVLRHESVLGIRDLGAIVMDLSNALRHSKAFVEAVRVDIEAFARADFADKEDRKRRDVDLQEARLDLKLLEDENRDKDALRSTSVKRLADLILQELSNQDPAFRSLNARSDQLKKVLEQIAIVGKLVEPRSSTLTSLVENLTELESIPERREDLDNKARKLRRDSEDAEHRRSRATSDLNAPTSTHDAAVQAVNQAKTELELAQAKRDAYLAESQAAAEISSDFDFAAANSSEAEFEQRKTALQQAQEYLRQVTGPYSKAKQLVDEATKNADDLRKQLENQSKEIDSLLENAGKLKKVVAAANEDRLRTESDFLSAAQHYAILLSDLAWLDDFRLLKGVPAELSHPSQPDMSLSSSFGSSLPGIAAKSRELTEFEKQLSATNRFQETLKSDVKTLQYSRTQISAARTQALQQRSHILLETNLANELVFKD